MGFWFVIGILIGIVFAVSITMLIMISIIKRSNDWGDNNGLEATMVSFEMLEQSNKVKKSEVEQY